MMNQSPSMESRSFFLNTSTNTDQQSTLLSLATHAGGGSGVHRIALAPLLASTAPATATTNNNNNNATNSNPTNSSSTPHTLHNSLTKNLTTTAGRRGVGRPDSFVGTPHDFSVSPANTITTPSPQPQGKTTSALVSGYLRNANRTGLSTFFHRPTAAVPILMESLETQRLNWSAFRLRVGEAASDHQEKLLRLQSLRQQQARREALNAQDAEGIQRTAEMLEEVVVAVRERQTSLSPIGYQAFVFQNQDVYEGTWKNARMHGKGILRRASSKDMYEGQWFLGQRNGPGMHHSSTYNTFYTGSWLENKRQGRGELLEPEGLYSGEFHDNHIHGYGEYVYHDGHVYKGEWVMGVYEGVGTYISPSGTKYEGGWRGGYEHGKGTRYYFNGDVYTGEWRFGLPHGYGTYNSSAFQYEGDWGYGTVKGRGVCLFSDGSRYDGEWMNGKFHGLGSFSTAERRITYMGEFQHGKRHGRGEYNGCFVYYNGDWKNDKKHGVGTAKIRECGYYHGEWRDDYPEGRGTYRLWDEEMVWFENSICVKIEDMSRFRILGMKLGCETEEQLLGMREGTVEEQRKTLLMEGGSSGVSLDPPTSDGAMTPTNSDGREHHADTAESVEEEDGDRTATQSQLSEPQRSPLIRVSGHPTPSSTQK